MTADYHGLPLIVCLCALNAALVTWCAADLHADARLRRAQAVAERNLAQAERNWIACLEDGYFTVGTSIYLCNARRIHLAVAQVPEIWMRP